MERGKRVVSKFFYNTKSDNPIKIAILKDKVITITRQNDNKQLTINSDSLYINSYFISSRNNVLSNYTLTELYVLIGENEDIWEVLGGSNKKLLTEKLAYIRKNIHSEKYYELEKIGLVLDADDVGIKGQIALLNEVLKTVFSTDTQLQNENESIEIAFVEQGIEAKLSFIFYCMKVEDKGELFTVLRKIKKMQSHYADCLA